MTCSITIFICFRTWNILLGFYTSKLIIVELNTYNVFYFKNLFFQENGKLFDEIKYIYIFLYFAGIERKKGFNNWTLSSSTIKQR